MSTFTLSDYDARPIAVGTRVRRWDDDDRSMLGTVTDLGEWDGDVDDYGRHFALYPRITVRWDDGTDNDYVTSEWDRDGDHGQVEEVVVDA